MKNLIATMVIVFAFAAFGAVDDPPNGYTAKEKAEWISANCKWKVAKSPEYAGYSESAENSQQCFALGRYNFIQIDNDENIKREARDVFRDDILIFYDDHQGRKELCHLIPVKKPYEQITQSDFEKAYTSGKESFEKFIERLDQNISLQCLMM